MQEQIVYVKFTELFINMGLPMNFALIFTKENNFYDFYLLPCIMKFMQNGVYIKKKNICFQGIKLSSKCRPITK